MSEKYTWDWTRRDGKNKDRVVVYCGEEKLFTARMENYEAIRPLVDDANRGAAAQEAQAVDLDALRERVLARMEEHCMLEGLPTFHRYDLCRRVNAAFYAAMKPQEQADAAKAADHP